MERKFSSSNYSPIFGTSSEGFYTLEKCPDMLSEGNAAHTGYRKTIQV
jgi:hypothetical protein